MNQTLTPEDLAMVKAIYEETGILTVRDKSTAHLLKAAGRDDRVPGHEYGVRFHPVTDERTNPPTTDPDVQWERTVIRECEGSPRWPNGIPVGGYTVFNRNTPLSFMFGDKDFKAVNFRRDVAGNEFTRLRQMSLNRVYLTDAERNQREQEAIQRAQGMRATQQDPVGTLAAALGPAIEKALTASEKKRAAKGGVPA